MIIFKDTIVTYLFSVEQNSLTSASRLH